MSEWLKSQVDKSGFYLCKGVLYGKSKFDSKNQ